MELFVSYRFMLFIQFGARLDSPHAYYILKNKRSLHHIFGFRRGLIDYSKLL